MSGRRDEQAAGLCISTSDVGLVHRSPPISPRPRTDIIPHVNRRHRRILPSPILLLLVVHVVFNPKLGVAVGARLGC